MKAETKEILKDRIQEVNQSKTSFLIGAAMKIIYFIVI